VLTALAAEGVEVEQLHPEYAPGQFELAAGPADPVAAADRLLLVRHTIRAVTERSGMRCSFAPMLVAGGVGNGCHVHTSLWRDGRNLTDGPDAEGEAFLAGVLDGLPALLAVGAPSVASYLRLVPQRWAAPFQCWGRENREAALRLIAGGNANAEVKCLDAAANPYLLVGALIALGLDGIDRGLRLPPEVTVDPATLPDAPRLPRDLGAALERFRASRVFADAMGPELFGTIAAVREAEIAHFDGKSEDEVVAATRFRYCG
jgi:glutamine synthetase